MTARNEAIDEVLRLPEKRQIERTAGRVALLLELLREGCPHGCADACPHTRKLREKLRVMGVSENPDTLSRR